jgi:hypothetical protein
MIVIALPAYGRDYKSKTAVIEAWKAGKDFRHCLTDQYLSIRDNIPEVWIRYNQGKNKIKVTP